MTARKRVESNICTNDKNICDANAASMAEAAS
jgi:hypothetical protein